MKISNNALNFLLAQYRAIFKRAYVKGIASAVLLTAGLAAGQAQAVDQPTAGLDDGNDYYYYNSGSTTWAEYDNKNNNYLNNNGIVAGAIGGAALLLFIVQQLSDILTYRKTARLLQGRMLFFTVPVLRFVRPFRNCIARIKSRHAGNYTWQ